MEKNPMYTNEMFGMGPMNPMNMSAIGMNINDKDSMNSQMMNPMMQYEQMYMYYKYLTQMMEYKLLCKEYEKYDKNRSQNNQ